MIFTAVFLVILLPVSCYPIFRQQYKQVFWIETCPHSFIHSKHMAHVLPAAADLVLTFENQDALRFQNSVCFGEHICIASVQTFFIRIYAKPSADDISAAGSQ